MKISFCAIVKDNSEVDKMGKMLETVVPYVDTIHITSNGKDVDEIEAYVYQQSLINPTKTFDYTHLPWKKDFSEQRNYNFSRVPDDTDYIFWLDCDDLFVGGEHLRPLAEKSKAQNLDIVFLSYWYGCEFDGEPSEETFKEVQLEHYRERLIKPGVITWKKRLHETPVPVNGQKDKYVKVPYHPEKNPIAIMHTSSMEEGMIKLERNREILELELEAENKAGKPDARTILYLMKIYAEIGDEELLEKCLTMGDQYLKLSGWDEERGTANDLMSICSSKLGRDQLAIKFLHQAIIEYPLQPLYYIRLSLAYFNVKKYNDAKHWLSVGAQMDTDKNSAGINNIKEMKVLFAQMLLKLKYNVDKDLPGAVEAAKLLLKEQPLKENEDNLMFLMDLNDLNEASEATKFLIDYLEGIGDSKTEEILKILPHAITNQPWAIKKKKDNTPPRIWADNEVCYLANFGQSHFEKWDGNSLVEGIGGSETAVIRLAEEWTQKGYKVTVYGDPEKECMINGVTYLPWHAFNQADKFNIFIQWRSGHVAPVIKAKKFYVDLHDVVAQVDFSSDVINAIDGVFLKSEYHADMLPKLPKDKKLVIGNGILV